MKRTKDTIEKIVFSLLLVFLPTQLGKHFWPDFSFVQGVRIDYLSPTLYVTDILILLLFIVYIFSLMKPQALRAQLSELSSQLSALSSKLRAHLLLFALFVFLLVNILLAKSPMVGWLTFLKLLEFVWFGYYIAKRGMKIIGLPTLLLLLAVSIFFESLLAIAQFLKQSSLDGFFYFLGERHFTGSSPGIANASLGGKLLLRPYATFPHPNVLAGFLVICMALIISNIKYQISNIKKGLFFTALLLGTVALLLTMSRIALLVWAALLVWFFMQPLSKKPKLDVKWQKSLLFVLLSIIIVGIVFTPLQFRFFSPSSDSAFVDRTLLAWAAIEMFRERVLFGVGLGNFLVALPSYLLQTHSFLLQPVHNVYLLLASETGIAGILATALFLHATLKRCFRLGRQNGPVFLLPVLVALLILGLFDHYFLTLQQGRFLTALVLGLLWAKKQ